MLIMTNLQNISIQLTLANGNYAKCAFNEEFKFLMLPISYSAVFLVGLPLNMSAIWIFITKMRPWRSMTVYMFNLALSDLLYVLSLPTLIYYYANRNNWPFGEVLCKIVRFLFYANLYCSILFLTCVSVHRYIGICHPLLSLQRVKVKHARMVCAGVWLAVSLCLVPNLFFVTISTKESYALCHDTTSPDLFVHFVEYSTAVMSLLFGVPCLVISCCYGLIAKELMKPQVNENCRTLPSYKKKSIKTIAVILIVFAICFLPFHITRTLYYYARVFEAECHVLNAVNVAYKITRPLASANSCIDSVLYFLASDRYQRRLVQEATRLSRRFLAAGHSRPFLCGRGDGIAVICADGAHTTGRIGNLSGEVAPANRENERDVEERKNSKGTLESNKQSESSWKQELYEEQKKNLGQKEDVQLGKDCNRTEVRGGILDGSDTVKVEGTGDECTVKRQKFNIKKHRKQPAGMQNWSLHIGNVWQYTAEGNLEKSPCKAESSSAWNLLDSVDYGEESLESNNFRGHCCSRDRMLQTIPSM